MSKMFKCISAGILSISVLFGTAELAFAAYDGVSGSAGSTSVYCEVGFNGGTAYAIVSANDDVDAIMDGEAYYYDGVTKLLKGGFSQRTYGDVSVSRDESNVGVVSCYFTVCGYDDDYTHYSYAH